MANELSKKGAQPSRQTRYGVLWTNRMSTGVWTQRSPLRDAASTRIEEEFYGARGDALIDGLNCEISSNLTFIRRGGSTVYNNQTFPAINRFYENRTNIYNASQTFPTENIQVVADVEPLGATVATLNISTVQITRKQTTVYPVIIYEYFANVTYTTAPPTPTTGQTWTFSGLTTYTALNGQAITGGFITVSGNTAKFYFGSATALYGPASDTGTTVVSTSGGGSLYGETIRDVTGPSTNKTLFTKNSGAGPAYFQSVGNSLYFTDGPEQKKLITPSLIWAPGQSFKDGDQILDSNGNLQVVQGTGTLDISQIQVVSSTLGVPGGPTLYFLAITFSSDVFWSQNTSVSFSGVTTYTTINGQSQKVVVNNAYLPPYANVAYFTTSANATYGPVADTGTATSTTSTTGSGVSGTSVPTWSVSLGGYTTDNQLTWQNFGVPLYNWGVTAPTSAPTITPAPGNRQWTPNTTLYEWYSVLDNNNNIEVVINYVAGIGYVTGAVSPTWSDTVPTFTNGTGGQTVDNGVVWQNCGPILTWAASTAYQAFMCVLDSNGNLQIATDGTGGASHTGTSAPTWATTVGSTTSDGTITWTCVGYGSVIITGNVYYSYSWVGTDGSVSTAAPFAAQNYGTYVLGPSNNPRAIISGSFSSDPQIAAVWIWRSVQGGSSSTLFFDSSVANPTPGTASNWSFTDYTPDTFLDELIEAPINDENDPPPTGIAALTYHLGCIWAALGNTVRYSDGPLVTSGNGNTAWSPGNVFVFPSSVTVMFPISSGLLVFTSSSIYIIQGTNTDASPLYSIPFLQNIGILSYDAFTVNGSIVFLYTSDNQVLSLDPASGLSEVGFPIGDQFGPTGGTETFNPTTVRVTWHVAQSQDKGLYVSDFAGTWWRMCPTPSPESGTTWSPKAQIVGGFSTVQSVETSPGIHNLLLGPPATGGPILQRNYQVFSDNGSSYPAWSVFGSVVLAQPGQLAMVESLTTDSIATGTPLSLAIQLDEISSFTGLSSVTINATGNGYAVGDLVSISGGNGGIYKVSSISGGGSTGPVSGLTVVAPGYGYPLTHTGSATTALTGIGGGLTVNISNGGLFEALTNYEPDPTELEPSITLYAQRFYVSQTQKPAACRHLQILINFGSDTVKNEVLSLSLFGAFDQEK